MERLRVWLALTDLAVITWATFGAQFIRFGIDGAGVASTQELVALDYTTFSLGLIAVWWLALRLHGLYSPSVLGHGAVEYRLLGTATLRIFAGLALIAFAVQVSVARGYIMLALPAGLVGLYAGRRLWRRWLGAERRAGRLGREVLVAGEASSACDLVAAFTKVPTAGYRVVGVCTSTTDEAEVCGVPVLGSEHDVAKLAIEMGVDVVACSPVHRLGVDGLRRLGWALEGSDIELVVSPGLTEVAGPRVLTRPVAGLPLIYVEAPKFSGAKLAVKASVDWVGATALVVLFSPLLLVVAAAIKLQDGGPVFFRQQRVGLDGRTFDMIKFRSMAVDAEQRLGEMKALQEAERAVRAVADGAPGDGTSVNGTAVETKVVDRGVLFKMEHDPRVTRTGRFIRRYSIDELPQLFNVLGGRMSLVGPRPPLPDEVSRYETDVNRRLLVKPGMTGLWQINGRSNLSWEESVRFDLYYVENWSIVQDLLILWRTLSAVVGKDGAY